MSSCSCNGSWKVVEEGEVLNVFQNPQAPITKKFVSQVSGATHETQVSLDQILANYKSGKIVKLSFVGQTTEQPVISQIIKQFDIDVNIVQGNISHTTSGPYGTLFVHIDGNDEQVEGAIAVLTQHEIQTEVIDHA